MIPTLIHAPGQRWAIAHRLHLGALHTDPDTGTTHEQTLCGQPVGDGWQVLPAEITTPVCRVCDTLAAGKAPGAPQEPPRATQAPNPTPDPPPPPPPHEPHRPPQPRVRVRETARGVGFGITVWQLLGELLGGRRG